MIATLALASLLEVSAQHIILPTYRPPPTKGPVTMRAKRNVNDEPLWLYKGNDVKAPATGDHPFLPKYIDDIRLDQNTRYARSVDSPSAKRGGSAGSRPTNHDTGATHPGYNRRNARDIRENNVPYKPYTPIKPSPYNPNPRPSTRFARETIDFEDY